MLDPRRVLTFCEVARQRSFSRAAEALALTQPAVSQQIRALEQQLGEQLIRRGPGGFALTATGELLSSHAEALSERLQLAQSQLGETVAAGRRLLRLGAFPSALATLVPAAIARLQQSQPELEMSAEQGTTEELVAGVREGRLHVALCFQDAAAPRREHADTSRHDLLDEPLVVAIGPQHRLAGRARIRVADLAGDTWTAATRDGLIHRACLSAGFEPRIAYLTGDPLAIRAIVAAGLAVTLTPRLLLGQLHGIATPTLTGDRVSRSVYAVTPSIGAHPRAAPFLDALRDAAQRRIDASTGSTG
jgi:DNA-binding transcriptional LysR family regulator